jgi:hypothetical protein
LTVLPLPWRFKTLYQTSRELLLVEKSTIKLLALGSTPGAFHLPAGHEAVLPSLPIASNLVLMITFIHQLSGGYL